MNKKQKGYIELLSRLDGLDVQVSRVQAQLQELRNILDSTTDTEEVCQDEIDADAAAMEIINDICIESLLDIKAKGDA